jgi:hypothetical protein
VVANLNYLRTARFLILWRNKNGVVYIPRLNLKCVTAKHKLAANVVRAQEKPTPISETDAGIRRNATAQPNKRDALDYKSTTFLEVFDFHVLDA